MPLWLFCAAGTHETIALLTTGWGLSANFLNTIQMPQSHNLTSTSTKTYSRPWPCNQRAVSEAVPCKASSSTHKKAPDFRPHLCRRPYTSLPALAHERSLIATPSASIGCFASVLQQASPTFHVAQLLCMKAADGTETTAPERGSWFTASAGKAGHAPCSP